MRTLPPEARVRNVTGKERCRWCGNSRYVVVSLRKPSPFPIRRPVDVLEDGVKVGERMKTVTVTPSGREMIEEMGPCPFCEGGALEEFPTGQGVKMPWGPDGFWAPREQVEVVALEADGARPEPPPVQRERYRELLATLQGTPRPVEPDPQPKREGEPGGLLDA